MPLTRAKTATFFFTFCLFFSFSQWQSFNQPFWILSTHNSFLVPSPLKSMARTLENAFSSCSDYDMPFCFAFVWSVFSLSKKERFKMYCIDCASNVLNSSKATHCCRFLYEPGKLSNTCTRAPMVQGKGILPDSCYT